jgi:CRISPR-associated protein Cmr6
MNSPSIPRGSLDLLAATGSTGHPGLLLDKFTAPGKMKQQKQSLDQVARATGDRTLFAAAHDRRSATLSTLGASVWSQELAAPLALHLARAGAHENAGTALHPLLGFAMVPGSGLKGIARAWAETAWLPQQDAPVAALSTIHRIFGRSPATDQGKTHLPDNMGASTDVSSAASVAFHDAWPTAWPQLAVDISNNHHPSYYSGRSQEGPGDWENPIPVYFLAIEPGTSFSFAVSPGHPSHADTDDLTLATSWLAGALTARGAGAKSAAGYGVFLPPEKGLPTLRLVGDVVTVGLELQSPAFLAGAGQQAVDCVLRGATLRGQLRWWWRTLHSAHLDVRALRNLEGMIWGTTAAPSPLLLRLVSRPGQKPRPYDVKNGQTAKPDFSQRHHLQEPPNRKTSQGLFYASFGMNDPSRGEQQIRHYLEPDAAWDLTFSSRPLRIGKDERIPARMILDQARAALWLLCHYGGVGSRSRKGFGSLACNLELDLEGCRSLAAGLRRHLGLAYKGGAASATSSIDAMLEPFEIETPWKNAWTVLDQVGYASQAFAQHYKHNVEKRGLGLPRNIGAPQTGRFTGNDKRHAAPVHYHLARRPDGAFTVRVVAFPSPRLGGLEANTALLHELLVHLDRDLAKRVERLAGIATTVPRKTNPPVVPAPPRDLPGTQDIVQATLLEEKTRKGGWKARHDASGVSGPIQNSIDVPTDKNPGDRVRLKVANVKASPVNPEVGFRWIAEDA